MATLVNLLASGFILVVLYQWYSFHRIRSKISSIPTIGSDRFFWAYLDAWKFVYHGQDMLKEGYLKYKGNAFKVPILTTSSRWLVVVSGERMIDDMRKAPMDVLSFRETVYDLFDYSIGPKARDAPFHVTVVRSPLTRSVPSRFAEVRDEVITACGEYIDAGDEWKGLPFHQTIIKVVTRSSNRLFVGLPLCRDPEYCKIQAEWTIHIMVASNLLNITPFFLQPIVARILHQGKSLRKKVEHKFVGAAVKERLEKFAQYGSSHYEGKQNDLISWLVEGAPPEHRNVEDITFKIMLVNLLSIHTTSISTTNALFNLAARQEYIAPLRSEIEKVTRTHGWTKEAMGRLEKLDSFMKESSRVSVAHGFSMGRKALKDFTFSNGLTIPAGYTVAAASVGIHNDPEIYEDPDTFKGFRFYEDKETGTDPEESDPLRQRMVSLDPSFLVFGHGRNACPGRFFAVNEVKALLAHIIMNYDVKLPGDATEVPAGLWRGGSRTPDPSAHILFRKRRLE